MSEIRVLSRFRTDFHGCLTARADALFELTEAVALATVALEAVRESVATEALSRPPNDT